MLIAVSGSQGSGKTTLLTELKKKGYNIIERKSARSILNDWNVTLDQVNEDHDLTIKFQEEITKRKYEDEHHAIHYSNKIWFTERTHADLFVYALIDLGRVNEYSDWVNEYYNTCLRYNQHYERVYYLQAGKFQIEHDGVRGANGHYSKMVDLTMLDTTRQMVHPSKFAMIDTPYMDQRINIIDAQCMSLRG
jgi:predicted ATPase